MALANKYRPKSFSEVIGQELDYDPSEGQGWNWEDYE